MQGVKSQTFLKRSVARRLDAQFSAVNISLAQAINGEATTIKSRLTAQNKSVSSPQAAHLEIVLSPVQLKVFDVTPTERCRKSRCCSAAVQGQAEVIGVLVAAGADTDLKVCRGKEGASHDASPLLLAVVGGHLEAARVLLEGG